jgi:hypothetical protein
MTNPFTLDKSVVAGSKNNKAKIPAKSWTNNEIKEKLEGYLEIKDIYWDKIKHSTHVRYITKNGEFKPGGFVLKNPFDTKPKGSDVEKRFIKLQNGFNINQTGYAQWIVAYEDIDKLFMKVDAGILICMEILEASVKGLNENDSKLAEYLKRMDARVKTLEKK